LLLRNVFDSADDAAIGIVNEAARVCAQRHRHPVVAPIIGEVEIVDAGAVVIGQPAIADKCVSPWNCLVRSRGTISGLEFRI